ncbi:MAG: hypothetical protein ACRDAX_08145 [Propionibacteriaceae bacterium]
MDSQTLIFLISLLGVGILLLTGGFLITRRREKAEQNRLRAPIQRNIPNLPETDSAPNYLSLDDIVDNAPAATGIAITAPPASEALPCGGYVDSIFATQEKLAQLANAIVLCVAEELESHKDLIRLLQVTSPHPIVIAAQYFSDPVKRLAAANHLHHKRQVILISCNNPEVLAKLLGTDTLSYADIQAGWLGSTALVSQWISSDSHSWIVSAKPSG